MKYLKYFENSSKLDSQYQKILDHAYNIGGVENEKIELKFEEIKYLLETDCKQFLDELKSVNRSLVFRGYKPTPDHSKEIFYKEPRIDRKTMNTPNKIQSMFDEVFQSVYGVKPRSNGVFTTTKVRVAKSYGDVFIFFPRGSYEYYWNENIHDLYVGWPAEKALLSSYVETGRDSYLFLMFNGGYQPKLEFDEYQEWIREHDKLAMIELRKTIEKIVDGYQVGNLEDNRDQEIIFMCDSYYMVDSRYIKYIQEWLDIDIKNNLQ
jgi:hypothetical protein